MDLSDADCSDAELPEETRAACEAFVAECGTRQPSLQELIRLALSHGGLVEPSEALVRDLSQFGEQYGPEAVKEALALAAADLEAVYFPHPALPGGEPGEKA